MKPEEVLEALDFVPEPFSFQRPDHYWVAVCEEHTWKYGPTSLSSVVSAMLDDHIEKEHISDD